MSFQQDFFAKYGQKCSYHIGAFPEFEQFCSSQWSGIQAIQESAELNYESHARWITQFMRENGYDAYTAEAYAAVLKHVDNSVEYEALSLLSTLFLATDNGQKEKADTLVCFFINSTL